MEEFFDNGKHIFYADMHLSALIGHPYFLKLVYNKSSPIFVTFFPQSKSPHFD